MEHGDSDGDSVDMLYKTIPTTIAFMYNFYNPL